MGMVLPLSDEVIEKYPTATLMALALAEAAGYSDMLYIPPEQSGRDEVELYHGWTNSHLGTVRYTRKGSCLTIASIEDVDHRNVLTLGAQLMFLPKKD